MKVNIGIYIFRNILAIKILLFVYNSNLYYQINKSNIKKIENIQFKQNFKLNFNLAKTKIVVGYNVKNSGAGLVAINMIKTILELIFEINDVSLGDYSFVTIPIEKEDVVHVDVVITFKNLLKILFGGIKWMRKKQA